jgi:hypothetical protein
MTFAIVNEAYEARFQEELCWSLETPGSSNFDRPALFNRLKNRNFAPGFFDIY